MTNQKKQRTVVDCFVNLVVVVMLSGWWRSFVKVLSDESLWEGKEAGGGRHKRLRIQQPNIV